MKQFIFAAIRRTDLTNHIQKIRITTALLRQSLVILWRWLMANQIPTHCAIPMTKVGKLQSSIRRAKAILALIRNDGGDMDLDGFYTSTEIIRATLSAIDDYLEQAEQSSTVDFYFTKGGNDE